MCNSLERQLPLPVWLYTYINLVVNFSSPSFWWIEVDASYCAMNKIQSDPHDFTVGLTTNDTKNATIVSNSSCMIIFSVCKQLPILCPNQGVCKFKGMSSSYQYISWPVNLGSMEYEGFKFHTGIHWYS